MERNRQAWRLIGIVMFVFLTACSSANLTWDPAEVDAVLTTLPETVYANEEVTLVAKLSGIPQKTGSDMRFDIQIDGKSNLIRGEDVGGGEYTLLFTFPRPGTYDVYIHYYQDNEHITKLKQLEVL